MGLVVLSREVVVDLGVGVGALVDTFLYQRTWGCTLSCFGSLYTFAFFHVVRFFIIILRYTL